MLWVSADVTVPLWRWNGMQGPEREAAREQAREKVRRAARVEGLVLEDDVPRVSEREVRGAVVLHAGSRAVREAARL